jgi:hypothetical protein
VRPATGIRSSQGYIEAKLVNDSLILYPKYYPKSQLTTFPEMTGVNFAELPNNTKSSWWRDPGMRTGMIHIFILYSAVYSLGYDGSLLNGLQGLPAWQENFDHPAGVQLGLIAATYYL